MSVPFRKAFLGEWFLLRKRRSSVVAVIIITIAGFLGSVAPRIEEKIREVQQQVNSGSGADGGQALNAFVYFSSGAKGAAILAGLFIALAAGGAIAGEAASGTLRIALARPVGRTRLFFAKFASLAMLAEIFMIAGTLAAIAGAAVVADFGPAVRVLVKSSTATLVNYTIFASALSQLAILAVLGFSLFTSTVTRNAAAANAVSIGFLVLCGLLTFALDDARSYLFASYATSPFDILRMHALGQDAPRPTWFGMSSLQDWADITFSILVPAAAALLTTFVAARIFKKKDWLA